MLSATLDWASYLGGSGSDARWGGGDITLDALGNAWVFGYTESPDLPGGGFDPTFGGGADAFVTKINASGSLAWCTYLGGSGLEITFGGIAIDSTGAAWVTGNTDSTNFPGGGPAGATSGGFVTKINADGSLAWTKYPSAWISSIAFDVAGNAWATGTVYSAILSGGGFDATYNGYEDVFVAKLDPNGDLIWESYLGGSNQDLSGSLALDASGNAWITGSTRSSDFPATGFDSTYNGDNGGAPNYGDAFVAKVNANGTYAWGSFLGGTKTDSGGAIAIDTSGNAWISGLTSSVDFPVGGYDGTFNGGYDGFIAKVNANGNLAWGSYMGGSDSDWASDIEVDQTGNAWVTGQTFSTDFPGGGFDPSFNGIQDAFVAKINANGTRAWGSYLGGSSYDFGAKIAVDGLGNAWIKGGTDSTDFPATGFDQSYNGGTTTVFHGAGDAFIAKISDPLAGSDLVVQNVSFSPTTLSAGGTFTIGFRVRNLGTSTAPATKARLRLSVDQNLTSYDKALSPLDVNIPAIPAGGYYDYSGTITVPAGTLAGQYYVGVFADALNTAGQSNITNDAGLSSTRLTVTEPAGVIAPVITTDLPATKSLNAQDTLDLQVVAIGTGPLAYQWFRNNEPLTGQGKSKFTGLNVGTSNAGVYRVQVSNAAGTAISANTTVTVSGIITPPASTDGQLIFPSIPNPNLPTIILTHGWQPGETFSDYATEAAELWIGEAAAAIGYRLSGEAVAANVGCFVWQGAYTGKSLSGLQLAKSATRQAGVVLAEELKRYFDGYNPSLQFIGHSLGTVVNAEAVHALRRGATGIDVEQFTILDAPMNLRSLLDVFEITTAISLSMLYSEDFFYGRLPEWDEPYGVDWVDNYYGTKPLLLTDSPGVGYLIPGAAPNWGKALWESHDGVHDWYTRTISAGGPTEGFELSVVLNGGLPTTRPAPQNWSHAGLVQQTIAALPSAISTVTAPGWGVVSVGGSVISDTITIVGQGVVSDGQKTTGLIMGLFGNAPVPGPLGSSPPGAEVIAELNVQLPSEATSFEFEYAFNQPGTGATVFFNGLPLISISGDDSPAEQFSTAHVPLGFLAGSSGVITIVLDDGTTTKLTLANFRLLDEAPPAPVGTFGYDTGPSIDFAFGEDVEATVSASDLLVTDKANAPVGGLVMSYDGEAHTVHLVPSTGPLPDGDYHARMPANSVADAVGNLLPEDFTFDFFILAADANRDRRVNTTDFNLLAGSFGQTGKVFSQGNFNYDAAGNVDSSDFAILAAQYGKSLSFPGDANHDGKVNTLDFNILAGNFGQSGKLFADGDFSGDGMVDGIDFAILAGQYGKSAAAPGDWVN